jgi:hypothetical protein
MARLSRGIYKMTTPRIGRGRVKATEGKLQVDNAKDRL